MTAAQATGEVRAETEAGLLDDLFTGRWLRRLLLFALLGLLQLLVNFPKFLGTTIDANVSPGIWRDLLHLPANVVRAGVEVLIGTHPAPFFERAMACASFMMWLLLGLLLLLATRRGGLRMLVACVLGLTLGYVAIHLISWLALAAALVVGGVLFIVKWIGILAFLIFKFLTHPIVLALLATLGAVLLRKPILVGLLRLWRRLAEHPVAVVVTLVLSALLVAIHPQLLRILGAIYRFVAAFLGPILHVLWLVLGFILLVLGYLIAGAVAAVAGLISLALLGSLLVSQLQAGWHAARSVRLMLVAGFAIGSALALVTLASIANPTLALALNEALFAPFGWLVGDSRTTVVTDLFQLLLPRPVRAFVFANLDHAQAPAINGLIFLAVTVLAVSSALVRLLSKTEAPTEPVTVRFVAKEYALMAAGLFVAIFLLFVQVMSGDSSA